MICTRVDSNDKLYMPLIGGLGNQLFQLAAALKIESMTEQTVTLYTNLLAGGPFGQTTPRTCRVYELWEGQIRHLGRLDLVKLGLFKLRGKPYWLSDGPTNPLDFSTLSSKTRAVFGYFQSRHVVDEVMTEIYRCLEGSAEFRGVVPVKQSSDITVHIRLGDKLSSRDIAFYGQTRNEYYVQGTEYLVNKGCYSSINVVSDDIQLARKIFERDFSKFGLPVRYVNGNTDLQDLATLTNASGLVLSCSSFSWWGARIAMQKHKVDVVAPDRWLRLHTIFDQYLNYESWKIIEK